MMSMTQELLGMLMLLLRLLVSLMIHHLTLVLLRLLVSFRIHQLTHLSHSSLDEVHVSPGNASNISDVGASVEFSTPISDDITVQKDKPSESIALYLPVAYDETLRKITVCNDDYKFAAFSHNILQEFELLTR